MIFGLFLPHPISSALHLQKTCIKSVNSEDTDQLFICIRQAQNIHKKMFLVNFCLFEPIAIFSLHTSVYGKVEENTAKWGRKRKRMKIHRLILSIICITINIQYDFFNGFVGFNVLFNLISFIWLLFELAEREREKLK